MALLPHPGLWGLGNPEALLQLPQLSAGEGLEAWSRGHCHPQTCFKKQLLTLGLKF